MVRLYAIGMIAIVGLFWPLAQATGVDAGAASVFEMALKGGSFSALLWVLYHILTRIIPDQRKNYEVISEANRAAFAAALDKIVSDHKESRDAFTGEVAHVREQAEAMKNAVMTVVNETRSHADKVIEAKDKMIADLIRRPPG